MSKDKLLMDTEIKTKTRPKGRIQNKKTPPVRSNRLTLMMMRGRGKLRTCEFSFRLFVGFLLGLVLYLIVSVVFVHQYFDERSKNRIQTDELDRLKYEIEVMKKEHYRARQRLAFLEDYAYQKGVGDEQPGDSIEPEEPSPQKETKTVSKSSGETLTGEVNGNRVAINDLVMERGNGGLTVRFKLLNIDWGKAIAVGYVHTIAKDKESEPHKVWTFPEVTIENGMPVDYKQGEYFSIKRYKTIHAAYSMDESCSPSSIQVLIYDQSGKVIFDQDYMVGNAS